MKTTDSGYAFHRKLRDILHIPEERLLDYYQLCEKLSTNTNLNVILVDDFVGSGHQTYVAWEMRTFNGKTLSEWSLENNHCVIYAPLVVNYIGEKIIEDNCQNLGLTYIHKLTPDYSIFSKECPCWRGDEGLYERAMKLIVNKSIKLNIPYTRGGDVIDVMGYRKQGLALAFAHGIPDACPPIFYWETENWKPLIHKVYKRP